MIDHFVTYLRSIRGYADNTIRAYESDCRGFAAFIRQRRVDARWGNITRDDIDAYMIALQEAGKKPTTTNRILASLSALYRYFQREGLTDNNPCKYESRRKTPTTIPTTINVKQLQKAYDKATGMTKTMLGLLASTGIRLQELLNLNWEDIDFTNNSLRIHGKGSKERLVYTSASMLASMRERTKDFRPSGRIFWIGQRTARYRLYHALVPYCKASQLSPHAIRHTYATELAKAGVTTAEISKILGHTHLNTAQKYIDLAQVPMPKCNIILN